MPRAKSGPVTRHRRKAVLKLAKGYYGGKRKHFREAKEQVMRSQAYATRDRKKRKIFFHRLWITRLSAALKKYKISYSRFINRLTLSQIIIDRRQLSEMSINNPDNFDSLIKKVLADNPFSPQTN